MKNVPESNGRVGILGISYDGFTPLMALVDPHPALKVSVPMNPMVDGWTGDDWFHHGAFRLARAPLHLRAGGDREVGAEVVADHYDDYDKFLAAGTAGEIGRQRGMEQLGFWRKLLEHPTYDAFWQDQAMDRILAARPLEVPVMVVHGLWDQEDIYGAPAVYRALEKQDPGTTRCSWSSGPGTTGRRSTTAAALGAIRFNGDTALSSGRRSSAPSSTTT